MTPDGAVGRTGRNVPGPVDWEFHLALENVSTSRFQTAAQTSPVSDLSRNTQRATLSVVRREVLNLERSNVSATTTDRTIRSNIRGNRSTKD